MITLWQVAELAQRKGDSLLAQRASKLEQQLKSSDDISARNKMDDVYRYVQSIPSPPSGASDAPVVLIPSPSPPTVSLPPSPRAITISPDPEEVGEGPQQEDSPPPSYLDRIGVKEEETHEQIRSHLPLVDWEAAAHMQTIEERLDCLTFGHTGELWICLFFVF